MQIRVILLVVSFPVALGAQTAPANSAPIDTLSARQAFTEMKEALRDVVIGQEAYWFNRHESYTSDLVIVREGMRKQPAAGVVLAVLFADKNGWAATAEHRALPGRSCVMVMGSLDGFPPPATIRDKRQPTPEDVGAAICDAP
jgi:hypothetical protein